MEESINEDKYSIVSEYEAITESEENWFSTTKVSEDIYLTTEPHFYENNRCNIWLVKG